ncbi:molybdenum cofactor guanylyltransferase [Candidatus Poriferisocius sp.]|uniref:molybdenum cofactor guanylyltransferase n=1 Tax=Candidatus Poriferisocius sp. TaxID=3101276 RepID=UPI003B59E777
MDRPAFTGVVLAGGRSRRMGRDKAFVEVGGRWLLTCALEALADARQVLIVGGDDPRLAKAAASTGADVVADDWPGQGPLGAVITALRRAHHPVTVVLPCDLPDIGADDVDLLVRVVAQANADPPPVAAAFADHRRHHLPLAMATGAVTVAEQLFASGKRSMAALLDALATVEVPASPKAVDDVDRPADLHRIRR